ncbi:MAG: hypothetical protein WCT37_00320 [Patescibacteria group bacterium]|jgi:hypothetical protein
MIKKIALTYLILALAIFLSGGLFIYFYRPAVRPVVNANINFNQTNFQDQFRVGPANPDEYKGEITNLDDGWKQYINQGWKISFKFRDPEDKFVVGGGYENIDVSTKRWIEVLHSGENYNYLYKKYKDEIQFVSVDKFCGELYGSNTLEKYVKDRWNGYQELADLVSIDELVNSNGVKFFKVVADVSGGMQSPGFFRDIKYYTQYPLDGAKQDRIGRICDLIEFRGDQSLSKEIIQFFQFIK